MRIVQSEIIRLSGKVTLSALLCFITACSSNPTLQATSTPDLRDISGIGTRVFLDSNDNGQIDSTDLPLSGIEFTVIGKNGAKASAITDDSGYALVYVSGLSYPVLLQVTAPSNSGYVPVGTGEKIMSRDDLWNNGLGTEFLFVEKTLQ